MPIIANPNGSIKYSVNDMKVAGDCCFFCGEMTIPTDHYILPPILDRTASFDKKGYIACLYLDSIEDPYNPNVRCRFCLIDNTIEMTKMAIYSYSSDTAIAMIGKYDNFVITQDTVLTALFDWSQSEGFSSPDQTNNLFTLTPNPAHNNVTVTINPQLTISNLQTTITLTDASGRTLHTLQVKSHTRSIPLDQHPSGTYFVTLDSPDGKATCKLIKE